MKSTRCLFSKQGNLPIGMYTRCALYVAILTGLWLSFKSIEPLAFPVIKDFKITFIQQYNEDSLLISGEFNKVRDCEFISVVGYSNKKLIDVDVIPFVTRLTREQLYGPWIIQPTVKELELYARHDCMAGIVTTKLFEGAIVI